MVPFLKAVHIVVLVKVFSSGGADEKIDTVKWERMVASMNKQNSAEQKLPVEGIKNLNGKELQTVWKNYVQLLSQMLVTMGQNPCDKEVSSQFDNVLQEIVSPPGWPSIS